MPIPRLIFIASEWHACRKPTSSVEGMKSIFPPGALIGLMSAFTVTACGTFEIFFFSGELWLF